jgi:hypothetical protein
MFHLLMSGGGWEPHRGTFPAARTLAYTDSHIEALYMPGQVLDLAKITEIPALFASETQNDDSQAPARIGSISRARLSGKNYQLEYAFDPDLPPISNATLLRLSGELGINASRGINEFTHTHWAIKEADLFKVLLKNSIGMRPKPKVFHFSEKRQDPDLVAVMMPFSAEFTPVYETLQAAVAATGMKCLRADDIWDDDHVVQDVVNLLCTASVVICDLTGRNSNVFYEMGIAHALAREVIIITQSPNDVPFDVAHIRHVRYLPNQEGRKQLAADVQGRLETLRSRV